MPYELRRAPCVTPQAQRCLPPHWFAIAMPGANRLFIREFGVGDIATIIRLRARLYRLLFPISAGSTFDAICLY